ncbi:MAG: 2-succinyl-5-enolpyruvyl-6-hydroxy-3-cyclohexene-1-carboxylic-acid synthase [Chloroflexi bacterium]|nr:2-succinyl-5-enolpyruvyl-6-hydroxy-3-cyclohexene-1-carboxylic-acid synthase [Chloroflexota bacterium]
MPNPNTLYANTFIDALVAAGVTRYCVAPGSRHTPLVLALARHRPEIEIFSLLDERSAAFFALGLAIGSGEPAALVCTSGSAAANFFPAIVEAHQSRVPLIVLTADRPHELRGSGANQTIDQIKLYGDYADLFVDAPLPQADPPPVVIRHLRTLAARAVATASNSQGVVHINFPFRKPFEPTDDDNLEIDRSPPTRFNARPASGSADLAALLTDDLLSRRGLIYCGHGACRSTAERDALAPWIASLSLMTGFPVLAEYTANLRPEWYFNAYLGFLAAPAVDFSQAEVVIRFGAPPLGQPMADFLANSELAYHIYCSRAGEWADDTHSVTHHLTINPASVSMSDWGDFWPAQFQAWHGNTWTTWRSAREAIAQEIATGAYFDGAVVYDVVDLMPSRSALFAGNSLPVRHLDQFGSTTRGPYFAWANRGASGIDGNVSTALGIGAARRGQPLVAVLGDITLYHDMNGLLAINRCGVPATIVLLNNGGGGIFQRLPVREFEPHFSDYFITPHGLDFSHAAAMYGLDYVRADDRPSFRAAFRRSLGTQRSTLIEVRTDAINDLQRRADIMAKVKHAISNLDKIT